MSEKIKILYVDDEEGNLIAFRANFRKEYEVFTALSAMDAFVVLEKNDVQIIISDQRMPNMTGVEFLEQTVKLYPDSIRLLITGYTDIDMVIQAINQGQITKFIQKPWDWDKLALAIDHCATIYKSRIELKQKNEELQKVNEELNKFVYSVSHDLRSPLTSILGVINLTKINPELRAASEYFEMIEGRVLKLDDFIKKIIDYFKNARSEEVKDVVDFKSLIESIWDALKYQNRKIDFKLAIDQKEEFKGDLLRLKIIFENLISNAIKYQNPSKQVHFININVVIEGENARVTLSDNGIGIAKEHLDSIFKLFFRTQDTLQTEGTGIGLYIVKETVDMIGGKISVSSQRGVGTTFEFIIPNNKI